MHATKHNFRAVPNSYLFRHEFAILREVFYDKWMQAQRVNLRIQIHVLCLYPCVLKHSLTMALRCRNMKESGTFHESYFVECIYCFTSIQVAALSKECVDSRSPAEIVGSNPAGGMDVWCECCMLSGKGLCDGLITRPEESYRLWCVVMCDLEISRMRRPWPTLGRSATGK